MGSVLPTVYLTLSLWLSVALSAPSAGHSCLIDNYPNTADIANTTYVNAVKSVKIPSGTTYRYVFSPPFDPDKPFLLFLHGFPESSHDWHHQITYFTEQGYGIIAPDLLGYGGTDNPSDLGAFSFKSMTEELGQLLDCEGVEKVIGISHDFGSPLLSRLINYQPSRIAAVAFVGNGYLPPQAPLNAETIDAFNNQASTRFGYHTYGYWLFNNADDAAELVDQHLESWVTLAFTRNTSTWVKHFAPVGAVRQWLINNMTASDLFVSRKGLEQWKLINKAQGGISGSMKWYKSWMRGINEPDSQGLAHLSGAISQPVLLILADRDPINIPSLQLNDTLPFANNIRVRSVNAGHFLQLEAPHEVNMHLEHFLRNVLKPHPQTTSITVEFEACGPLSH